MASMTMVANTGFCRLTRVNHMGQTPRGGQFDRSCLRAAAHRARITGVCGSRPWHGHHPLPLANSPRVPSSTGWCTTLLSPPPAHRTQGLSVRTALSGTASAGARPCPTCPGRTGPGAARVSGPAPGRPARLRLPAWTLGLMRTTCARDRLRVPSICSSACWPSRTAASRPRQTGFELQPAQVDDLEHPAVDAHALAVLGQPLRHHAVDRARAARCRPAACGPRRRPATRGLVVGLGAGQAGLEVSSAVREMKPWLTSALLSSHCAGRCRPALGRLGLLLGLAQRAPGLGGSTRATTWPALTTSPSRRVRPAVHPPRGP
jgi:hypothetical protein